MKEQQVTQILHEFAEREVPASLDLWPLIRARLQPQRRALRRAPWMPATRLGWAGLMLGAILLFGGVAYALNPALSQVFRQFFPGWRHIEEAHLAQELHLSQTLDGVTVTLERAYADANEIVVGYTVKGLTDQRLHVSRINLTDEQGTVFSEMAGAGVTGASDILGVQLPPGEGAYVTSFDASPVEGTPASLRLRLTMHLAKLVPVDQAPPTPTTPLTEPSSSTVIVVPAMTLREEIVGGPFTFDFSVPFIPGRTVEVQQTVEAAGVAVRLKRVVITPSETRATVCFEPSDGGTREWTLIAALDAGDGQELFAGMVSRLSGDGEANCHRVTYPAALTRRSGLWTLTVTELIGCDPTRPGEDVRLAGPWVFRFTVP
jgi:hypothetical protein